ncbi:MAG: insulinase family protein [Bacteroidales bacterium]|nr:insulinase family protein [Bacteroidales bacterium]MDD2324064.1 insulinase family protein [Bacteroidales bacterium]MDY0284717.1 insulinase family protein [Bacteroidales bacterium]HPE86937.1 insulinase family protein [Bacteroidales bacterium]
MKITNLRMGLIALLLFVVGVARPQTANEIPLDEAVRYGRLENGLTYYVRENAVPEARAEFYLVVNAGAVLEYPHQNGLAHFCEHMAFNGTEHFKKHEIIEWLQSIGMKFGPEINAYTSHDNTTYMLQKVPLDKPGAIDTALLILHDWAGKVAFEDEEIDNERGVIHEEWRVGRSADFRMMNQYQKVVFQDSKYATHDVIGDIDIIDNFEYQTIKDFYNNWYRPDLQAIIAVGDFDGAVIEEKIKTVFGALENPENALPRVNYEVPEHIETRVSVVTDKEATQTMALVFYKHTPPAVKDKAWYRESILQQLYAAMINQRLQELLVAKNPPFVYAFSAYIPYVRTVDAYLAGALANSNAALTALEAVLTENQRVKEYGFTDSEFERSKEEFRSAIEKLYREKDKKNSSEWVMQYQSHFLDKEPAPGIEYDRNFVMEVLPGIQLEEINALADRYIRDKNRVVVISGPEKNEVVMPDRNAVMAVIEKVEAMDLEPYEDKVTDTPLVAMEPEPGKRAKKSKDKTMGTEIWTLKNGVKVVFKPTDFKDDEILMTAWSYGGLSAVKTADLPSAFLATDVVHESGLGKLDKMALQKKLTGKVAVVNPYIAEYSEGFRGSCSPQDFETLLQLVYLYFTEPRLDEDAVAGMVSRTRGMLENRSARPVVALYDTLTRAMAQYHPRVEPFTAQYLDRVDIQTAFRIFQRRFGDPSGFTFYFVGNLECKAIRPLIEKWLGGLPAVFREETVVDHQIRPPAGDKQWNLYNKMEMPQGTVAVVFTGEYDYDVAKDRLLLQAIADILDVRYTETIREDEGGTYGVGVQLVQEKFPYENYALRVQFNSDPERAEELLEIVYREMETLKSIGPREKDLQGFKENKIKTRQENLKDNQFWLSSLSAYDRFGTDKAFWEEYTTQVETITAEEVQEAARRFFNHGSARFILLPE